LNKWCSKAHLTLINPFLIEFLTAELLLLSLAQIQIKKSFNFSKISLEVSIGKEFFSQSKLKQHKQFYNTSVLYLILE